MKNSFPSDLKLLIREKLPQFIGFLLVGGSSTLVSIGLLALFNEIFHWHSQLSYVLSYLITLAGSYVVCAKWVFHSPLKWNGWWCYCCAYLSGMLLGMGVLKGLEILFPNINATLLGVATIPFTTLWNYLWVDRIMAFFKKRCKD